MVSALDSGSSSPGSSPSRGHCVVSLDKTRCINGYPFGDFNAGGNPAMDWRPIQGGVEIQSSRFILQKPG